MKHFIRTQKRTPGKSGQVLVEFALSIVVLFVIMGGIVDVGLLVWKANMMNQAVREGALFATRIRNDAADWTVGNSGQVASYVRGVNPIFQDTTKTVITVAAQTDATDFDTSTGGTIEVGAISVTIVHTHEFLTPFNAFGGDELDITRTYRVPFMQNLVEN